jgi:hypothetical protein
MSSGVPSAPGAPTAGTPTAELASRPPRRSHRLLLTHGADVGHGLAEVDQLVTQLRRPLEL